MNSFGSILKAAREAKGLTCSQVAAQTHLLVQVVEALEREDFSRIPAPIYGRGFVRLYCETVGIDPLPRIREFMEIYTKKKDPSYVPIPAPTIPEPAPATPPEPAPAAPEPAPVVPEPAPAVEEPEPAPTIPEPEPEPVPEVPAPPMPEPVAEEPVAVPDSEVEPPPSVKGLDLFEQSYRVPVAPTPAPAAPATPAVPAAAHTAPPGYESPFLTGEAGDAIGPSAAERFRDNLSSVSHGVISTVRRIPRSAWRMGAVATVAVITVALLAFGAVKLYEITSGPADNSDECPGGVCEFKPSVAEAATKKPKASSSKTSGKPATPAAGKQAPVKPAAPAPKKPVAIRSTGQNVPDLYVD